MAQERKTQMSCFSITGLICLSKAIMGQYVYYEAWSMLGNQVIMIKFLLNQCRTVDQNINQAKIELRI